jgi:hypothetical protein
MGEQREESGAEVPGACQRVAPDSVNRVRGRFISTPISLFFIPSKITWHSESSVIDSHPSRARRSYLSVHHGACRVEAVGAGRRATDETSVWLPEVLGRQELLAVARGAIPYDPHRVEVTFLPDRHTDVCLRALGTSACARMSISPIRATPRDELPSAFRTPRASRIANTRRRWRSEASSRQVTSEKVEAFCSDDCYTPRISPGEKARRIGSSGEEDAQGFDFANCSGS